MKRTARIVAALVIALATSLGVAYRASAPVPPPAGSESARLLDPGPLPVASVDRTFVDRSRATNANGDFAGAPERTLEATLWFPRGASGRHPLLVYSHGFMSRRSENVPLAELLASHGYVVVSMDYPLTNGGAPGGPTVADAVNQPGDVRFAIDRILGWSEGERPFAGEIDADRIGALGLSLGGLTTELVSFHPRLRDPRIRAALSIAGPAAFFDERFFGTTDIPFLMVAGTGDAMVDYQRNAATIPSKVVHGGLLSIANGSHAGFAAISDGFPLRLLDNPDSLGCLALSRNLEQRKVENPFEGLGGPEDGVVFGDHPPLPCQHGVPARALAPGRQQMITRLAALAFFESAFSPDAAVRAAKDGYLRETLAREWPEARYQLASAR
jgi:predicted dienelactone hydrolase